MTGFDQLRDRWRSWLERLGLEQSDSAFADLVRCYGEPGRAYHNLDHLAECLAELDRNGHPQRGAIEPALWFHDAIYDSHAEDNEARSAELARAALVPLGTKSELLAEVEQLILATRHATV